MSFQIYVGVFVGDDGYVRIADRLKAPDSNVETYSLYGFFRAFCSSLRAWVRIPLLISVFFKYIFLNIYALT